MTTALKLYLTTTLTQSQIARKLGVSRQAVGQRIKGHPRPAHLQTKVGPAHTRAPATSPFALWFDASGIKAMDLAAQLGITVAALYNLRRGLYSPSLEVATKIEAVSDGAIAAGSWFPVPKAPRKRRAK